LGLGAAILAGIFITNHQIVKYQEEDVDQSKQVALDSFQRLADRKERRLETIAAGLVGFYKSASPIDTNAFQGFVKEITRVTPDLRFIVVTEDGVIAQSYPENLFVIGAKMNEALGNSYLRNFQDETQVLFEFPMGNLSQVDRTTILAVGPSFLSQISEHRRCYQ